MQFPPALVFIAGFILALLKWSRHPKPAALVMIASILGLFQSISSALFTVWVCTQPGAYAQHTVIVSAWHIFIVILYVTISALLLAAAFIGRSSNIAPSNQAPLPS